MFAEINRAAWRTFDKLHVFCTKGFWLDFSYVLSETGFLPFRWGFHPPVVEVRKRIRGIRALLQKTLFSCQ